MGKKIIIVAVIFVLVLLGIFIFLQNSKIVFRQPLAPTPSTIVTPTPESLPTGWLTFTNPIQQVSFEYPKSLSTTYIRTQNWPPTIVVSSGSYSCKEGGRIQGQPLVIQKTMGNITFCIENSTQGAAGTMYSDYLYTFLKDSKLIKLQFTIAYPQCGNFPQAQMNECLKERQTFDLDSLISRIAQTVQISGSLLSQPSITTPQSNSLIQSPLIVRGTVPTGWMFEGVFPIKLLDADKKMIVESQAKETIPGSWNSGKPVEFSATLNFSTQAKSGYLVLEKDNPSGLPQNAATFEIPIKFSTP